MVLNFRFYWTALRWESSIQIDKRKREKISKNWDFNLVLMYRYTLCEKTCTCSYIQPSNCDPNWEIPFLALTVILERESHWDDSSYVAQAGQVFFCSASARLVSLAARCTSAWFILALLGLELFVWSMESFPPFLFLCLLFLCVHIYIVCHQGMTLQGILFLSEVLGSGNYTKAKHTVS